MFFMYACLDLREKMKQKEYGIIDTTEINILFTSSQKSKTFCMYKFD